MRKIIVLISALLILTGCTTIKEVFFKPLAKLSEEECVYDIRDEFDPLSILTDVQEEVVISYEIDEDNSKAVITLQKDDKTEVLEKDITILYPLGELLSEKIDYYTYKDFNDNEYIKLASGVTYTSNIDLGNKTIDYVLTQGDRTETYRANLNVINPLSNHELVSFKKGNKDTMSIIKLDDVEYCVFTLNGKEAQLLSMEAVANLPFNDKLGEDAAVNPFMSAAQMEAAGDYDHNGIKDEYDGMVFNDYENCTIDNYLENNFYKNLSQEVKDAIIEKSIGITWRGSYGQPDYTVKTISRHVYLGDIKDWQDQSVYRVFNNFVDQCILLRSQCGYNPIATWSIWSFVGNSDYWNIIFNDIPMSVRPMMVVDTTKLPETVLVR